MHVTLDYLGGGALSRGRIGAAELGPAILGLSEAITGAGRVLYGSEVRVSVDVAADFRRGSFGVDFLIATAATAPGFFQALSPEALSHICTILGLNVASAGKGLLNLLKWQRNRPVDVQTTGTGDVTVSIRGSSGNTVTITRNEYSVFTDPAIRKGVAAVARPVELPSISEAVIRVGPSNPESISKDDAGFITGLVYPETPLSTDVGTAVLEVIGPDFRDGKRWRFAQGQAVFPAEIADPAFLQSVAERKRRFGKGDALRVTMETEVTIRAGEHKFNRRILKVLDHFPSEPGGGQLQLPGTVGP